MLKLFNLNDQKLKLTFFLNIIKNFIEVKLLKAYKLCQVRSIKEHLFKQSHEGGDAAVSN